MTKCLQQRFSIGSERFSNSHILTHLIGDGSFSRRKPLSFLASGRKYWRAAVVAVFLFALPATIVAQAQQLDTAAVVQQVDAAVKARAESVAGYTVTEHYAVYRNKDEVHPVAEMTVKTTYKKNTGKSYIIASQSGSQIIRSLVLGSILDNEKRLNQPGIREGAWFTSANYEMKLKPGGTLPLNGRDCNVLTLTPRRKTPYLIEGTLWVDSTNGSIVQVQGTAAKSSSLLTGPTQVIRQYANVSGFSQAIHARAVSNSSMFGQTIVKIDYQNYQVQLGPPA
jgi:outer membrane lipoprotein-sorting protein